MCILFFLESKSTLRETQKGVKKEKKRKKKKQIRGGWKSSGFCLNQVSVTRNVKILYTKKKKTGLTEGRRDEIKIKL